MTTENTKKRVAVGLSGGVDSSVTAYLLKEQGYDVVGVHMVCWNEKTAGCTADQDRDDAARVAGMLGIKFISLDFVKAYQEKVIDYFYREYEAGRTPNPDVMCNKEIKFGLFYDWSIDQGFDFIATGHYARVENNKLLKGTDPSKDQSYFLYRLDASKLARILFPLGGMLKRDVRVIAEQIGLHNASKPDSVGICFIGEVDIKEFLKRRIAPNPGKVLDKDGEVVGTHDGFAFYTIGQRHGYHLDKYFGLPTYVIDKHADTNEIVIGYAGDVTKAKFNVADLNFINSVEEGVIKCDVRVRHLGELFPAEVIYKDGICAVKCVDPIFGVAPGQSAVFYVGDEMIGGGVILN